MKLYNIVRAKKYESQGQEKTIWLQVGSMRVNDKGNIFIEMNHSGQVYNVFPVKPKEPTAPIPTPTQPDINVDDIPF